MCFPRLLSQSSLHATFSSCFLRLKGRTSWCYGSYCIYWLLWEFLHHSVQIIVCFLTNLPALSRRFYCQAVTDSNTTQFSSHSRSGLVIYHGLTNTLEKVLSCKQEVGLFGVFWLNLWILSFWKWVFSGVSQVKILWLASLTDGLIVQPKCCQLKI